MSKKKPLIIPEIVPTSLSRLNLPPTETKAIIREFLDSTVTVDRIPSDFNHIKLPGNKMTVRQAIWGEQIMKAINGSGKAFDRILDRLEGKPTQTTMNLNYNSQIIFDDSVQDKPGKRMED